jgi:hypothetical protein
MKSVLFETQSGKPCATCSKCCEGWLTGAAYGYEFKPGTPCKFITNTGCGIYAARPEDPCKTFKCHWKINPRIPDWLRPDQSQVIILVKYIDQKRYLRLFNSGAWPESKVFECQQNGKKVTITGPKGAAVNAVDALEVFHRERPELFTTFVSDWPTRVEAAKWVLLPPLGLLLLGFVVVWAVRGFRP